MNHTIPTLRTERLTLRPLAMADFPAYRDFHGVNALHRRRRPL